MPDKELTPVRMGFPVYPRECPNMEDITDEGEVQLYYALRPKRGVVLDLGLCDRCEHTECKEHPDHKEYVAAKATMRELRKAVMET